MGKIFSRYIATQIHFYTVYMYLFVQNKKKNAIFFTKIHGDSIYVSISHCPMDYCIPNNFKTKLSARLYVFSESFSPYIVTGPHYLYVTLFSKEKNACTDNVNGVSIFDSSPHCPL